LHSFGGIGGSGMSGIAEVLLAHGFAVSGSDTAITPTTARLEKLGAKIFKGHQAENVAGATCVVISSAIAKENPELLEARNLGLPLIARAEMLAELMRLKMGIAIAGSHGKTTTTSMVGQFIRSLDPTVVVGGRLQHWNASSVVGRGSAFVIEADESDRSFLKFSPVYSVVTNVDREHMDTYHDIEDLKHTFVDFLNRTAFFGMNWVSADCSVLQSLRPQIVKPTKTYGFHESADLRVASYRFTDRRSFFELQFNGRSLGEFQIPVMGMHNIQNASAAIGIGLSLNVPVDELKERARSFVPADRRLQVHFENSQIAIVEDYGHHPTEIRAALEALKLMYPDRRRSVIFQPHRYTRTKLLWSDFAGSFLDLCDEVHLLQMQYHLLSLLVWFHLQVR
jgi:UDP-N-acetylmuramate--alanine ligase